MSEEDIECVDPNRLEEVIETLREKHSEILKVVNEDWVDDIIFIVRVCASTPGGYYPIKITISKKR